MVRNQQRRYVIGHEEEQVRFSWRIGTLSRMLHSLRALEDVLLLWSVPALLVITLLWAIGSALGRDVPFISFIVDLLVTAFSLIIASILLLKWIDTLQLWAQRCMHIYLHTRKVDQDVLLGFLGVSFLCLVLIGLILGTAATGGGDPRTALLVLVFLVSGWHYRTLLKRDRSGPGEGKPGEKG